MSPVMRHQCLAALPDAPRILMSRVVSHMPASLAKEQATRPAVHNPHPPPCQGLHSVSSWHTNLVQSAGVMDPKGSESRGMQVRALSPPAGQARTSVGFLLASRPVRFRSISSATPQNNPISPALQPGKIYSISRSDPTSARPVRLRTRGTSSGAFPVGGEQDHPRCSHARSHFVLSRTVMRGEPGRHQ